MVAYPMGCSMQHPTAQQEKQQLLQQWVETGENCDAIETQLKLIRSQEGEQERCRELLTIAEMRSRGFSQPLDVCEVNIYCQCILPSYERIYAPLH